MEAYSKKIKGKYPTSYAKKVPISDHELSYAGKSPGWSFNRTQREGVWMLSPKELSQECANCSVYQKLADFEKMTWQQVKQQTHGYKGKSSNHYISDIDNLNSKAKSRLVALGIDSVFSLRLTGTHRIFGVLSSQVLEIIWYDTEHEIYPLDKE